MEKEQLISELDATTTHLIQQLSVFNNESFNNKPSPEVWSAAQVGRHLLLIDTIANKVMMAPGMATNRPADSKLVIIKEAMEDFDTKRTSPDVVKPTDQKEDLESIINGLQEQREAMKEIVQTKELTDACTAFKHPSLGTLTRLEWVLFSIYHTRRHVMQLKQLAEI